MPTYKYKERWGNAVMYITAYDLTLANDILFEVARYPNCWKYDNQENEVDKPAVEETV